ncbi:MAG TPA: 3-isopropylmalate dehydrogenase [Candidatus Lokiarchaeia archaeon]|nr:3-isopropylmalate dehydrogenase [Candidatus Lokiarchaeia archaeon]
MPGKSDIKHIAVVEGDGIGPEIIQEAKKILNVVQEGTSLQFQFTDAPAGGNVYKETGVSLPDSSMEVMEQSDAILYGAIGLPDLPQGVAEIAVLKIRQHFDEYVNLRPVKLFESAKDMCPLKDAYIGPGIDILIVRENSESLYAKIGGMVRDEVASNLMIYTKTGVDRIIKYAFELAASDPAHAKVTSVDKANILVCSQMWRDRFHDIAKEYPDIKTEDFYVDAFCQWLIRKPYECKVVVTENMFGDIVSDEAAYLLGSLGMAPSGNINPNGVSMYEPIHGSAPDIAGKGIANPIGTILAAKLMLSETFKETAIAKSIEDAVESALGKGRTPDIAREDLPTLTTVEMGDLIASELTEILRK